MAEAALGVDVTVAMAISGHRTRSTFDPYNIVSTQDTAAAIEKTAAFVATLPVNRNVVELERAQNAHSEAVSTKAQTK